MYDYLINVCLSYYDAVVLPKIFAAIRDLRAL